MGQPAAKQGDMVVGVDIHIFNLPSPSGTVPTPLPSPFSGQIDQGCIDSVKVMGQPVAVKGSVAHNQPPHMPQGGPLANPPSNDGSVMMASMTVTAGGKGIARNGDPVQSCMDAGWASQPKIIAVSTVMVG
jgi:uncharacterized Zn-binding protein involved in type VI secretion